MKSCKLNGKPCQRHDHIVHGQEAEALRRGIDQVIGRLHEAANEDVSYYDAATDLQNLLDKADAIDSLAYLEANAVPIVLQPIDKVIDLMEALKDSLEKAARCK
jgi:hypothetical protein